MIGGTALYSAPQRRAARLHTPGERTALYPHSTSFLPSSRTHADTDGFLTVPRFTLTDTAAVLEQRTPPPSPAPAAGCVSLDAPCSLAGGVVAFGW